MKEIRRVEKKERKKEGKDRCRTELGSKHRVGSLRDGSCGQLKLNIAGPGETRIIYPGPTSQ